MSQAPSVSFAVGLPQLGKVVGGIVAPTTLLTALLFYFGWQRGYWFYDYLGVDTTVLGLSTADYLRLAVDGLFVPLIVCAFLLLLVLWVRPLLRGKASARLPLICLIAGAVLGGLGLLSVFVEPLRDRIELAAPLGLACGVLLLSYRVHLSRPPASADVLDLRRVVEWAGVFVVVGICLFWAATDYSSAVGRSRAEQFVAEMPGYPGAVVYSTGGLNLHAPGVTETRCGGTDPLYRFRYDGLTLVLQSDDQYLLLPTAWTQSRGTAVLLPRNDAVRLEFTRGPAIGVPGC
ncbi:hypothetical protein [Kribbella sp. NPDC006257]|uniref:hypothetical protein n=1 Tax=Kribbella sp. NPDC006257 TaxID=3156738 RepID=UPI0033A2167B